MKYPTSSSGQQIYADGFYDIVTRIHRDYSLPIVITENGISDYPKRSAIDDDFRSNSWLTISGRCNGRWRPASRSGAITPGR